MDTHYHILVVDDVQENIQVALSILKEDNYNFSFATSGASALSLTEQSAFDLILLDVMMPGMDGFEVCRRLKLDSLYRDVPVIFLTARADVESLDKGFKAGGVDYISKPFHAEELVNRVRTHLELYKSRQLLASHNLSLRIKAEEIGKRYLTELEDTQKEMIFILTELMEFTSDETGKHIRRVAEYCRLLAHYHQSLDADDEYVLYHASPMHDIGKVVIPEHILHKHGKLTDEEFEIMKGHTTAAHQFLGRSKRRILKAADILAHQHHEKWDGSGYPQGLKGESIHIYGRIVALADVFDALTHKRCYKDAWSVAAAGDYIRQQSGLHFDPYLVELFSRHYDEFAAIAEM